MVLNERERESLEKIMGVLKEDYVFMKLIEDYKESKRRAADDGSEVVAKGGEA